MTAHATPLTQHAPAGHPKGGIVVLQEAFGVNAHIEDVGRRFAAEGWLAVAPHLFHRDGDPVFGYSDRPAVMAQLRKLTASGVMDDVQAAIDHLAGAGIAPERTGVVGFCMGGSVALAAAASASIGAAVTFYGGGLSTGRFGFPPLIDEARRLRAPWLGLFGDLDESIPVEDVEAVRTAAASSGQPTEVVRYADAGHGFHCDERESYHEPSAKDAWDRTTAWFGRHLAG